WGDAVGVALDNNLGHLQSLTVNFLRGGHVDNASALPTCPPLQQKTQMPNRRVISTQETAVHSTSVRNHTASIRPAKPPTVPPGEANYLEGWCARPATAPVRTRDVVV